MNTFILATILSLLSSQSAAQFPPQPENITTLRSRFHEGISISYKEPGICETTPGVKSYAGYVHLPPNALNETHEHNTYPVNTFFWFFEARKDPHNAPLAIWLNGGPGGSSLMGALAENGPCFVGKDSNSTYLNPWSWNNEVNMLYIDQPVQVGYSYDYLTNITATLQREQFQGWTCTPTDFSEDTIPEQNFTFLVGTAGSQNVNFTANTTHHAAVAIWHFAQTWFEEFPQYKPHDEQISLFTESYGGHYGPAFVAYFMRQNELIANGTLSGAGTHYLHMNTLGIVNGGIDFEEQVKAYPSFANNNTFGIKAFTDEQYYHAMYELHRHNGILSQVHACRTLARTLDPANDGEVEEVNAVCRNATALAVNVTDGAYIAAQKHGWYDITHPATDSFPPAYLTTFLNQQWVQRALGVPVNHTDASFAVYYAFGFAADHVKADLLPDLAYILDHGVKVAMMYGERDYACNWVQGEASSLKIPWSSQDEFREAGYTPLILSPVHSGGLTRQYGNLSFTRVYQAGHLVPAYQPEAAYAVFMRALKGKDIATGRVDLAGVVKESGEQYRTEGPRDTWWKRSDVLPAPEHECYVRDLGRCFEEEKVWVFDGSAIVKDWVVVGREEVSKSASKGGQGAQVVLGSEW